MSTPEQNAAFERFVLAQLRVARAKARLLVNEIDAIGVALKQHGITAERALIALYDARSLAFLHSEPLRAPPERFYEDPDDPSPPPEKTNGEGRGAEDGASGAAPRDLAAGSDPALRE